MSNKLYINNNLVELSEEIAIPITYSIGDFKNPENRKRSSSKTLRINGTKLNKQIFSSCYQLDLTNTGDLLGFNFNPNAKVPARLYKDDVEIFNGLVRLINVEVFQDNYTFEIVLYSDFVNIFRQMEDISVSELDWSEYDHDLTVTNVSNTWDTSVKKNGVDILNYNGVNPEGFGYWYPCIDYGYNNTSPSTIKIENLVPYVYVKETFEKCFSNLGYSIDSDFLEENMIKALTWGFGGGVKENTPPSDIVKREVAYDYDGAFVSNHIPFNFGAYSSNVIDSFSLKDFNQSLVTDGYTQFDSSTGKITILRSGKYNLNLDFNSIVSYDIITGAPSSQSSIIFTRIFKNGSQIGITASGYALSTTPTYYAINSNSAVDLKAGDEITVRFDISNNFASYSNFSYNVNFDLDNNFSLDLTSVDSLISEGDIVSLNRFIPEMKCSEFVKGIINMFNLYVSEPDRDGVIKVEPLDEFYEGEENWTTLFDHSKKHSIKPVVNESSKYYHFKFKEDNDYLHTEYLEKYGARFGDYTFTSENEYKTKATTYQLPFAQSITEDIGSGYVIPRIIEIDDSGVVNSYKGEPRIFFNNGLKSGHWSINDSSGLVNYSYYPQAHHCYGNISNHTFDLNFSKPEYLKYTITNYRTNNLFSKYNRVNIIEQTSVDGKILNAYFNLTLEGLVDFRKLVNINGVLYRKNLVTDFDANGKETTNVELYKVLETTELNTSNPRIVQTIPDRGNVGVIQSPNGVGEGTPTLRGGANTPLMEQPILLQRYRLG